MCDGSQLAGEPVSGLAARGLEEEIQLAVRPEDGLCEGCREPLGDEYFETDDMVVLCRPCWEGCVADTVAEQAG